MAIHRVKYLFKSFMTPSTDEIVNLLRYCEENDLIPLKYDDFSSRPKHTYDPTKKEDVADFCYTNGSLIIKGKEFEVRFGVCKTYARPLLQRLEIKFSKRTENLKLINYSADFFRMLKSCYAYGKYNGNADDYTPGKNIDDCLFGFSWLNIFGKPYIDLWGREKILKAPAIVYDYDDFIILALFEKPFFDLESVKKKSQELKEYFGLEHFYDQKLERRKTTFDSIGDFIEYRNSNQETIKYVAPDFQKYYEYERRSGFLFGIENSVQKK